MKKIGEYLLEEHFLKDQDIPGILTLHDEMVSAGIKMRFGEASIAAGKTTPSQVNQALLRQNSEALARTSLGSMLHTLGDLDEPQYRSLEKKCNGNDETWEMTVLEQNLLTPERLKTVKDLLGLARHTYQRDVVSSQFIPFNMIEPLVAEKIDEVFEETGQCACAQCWNNVFAITLNDLPSRYISYTPNITEFMQRFRHDYSDDVLRILRMAAIKVKTNPRLACATVRRIETADLLGALPDFETVVHISNRHIHLCREDLDALFGRGHELVKMKDLQQPGQYAAEETVEITGPKGTLQKIRVLGPLRPQTQVEISGTDQFALGSSAPVRESGDVAGTPGIRLTGPTGNADIKQGLIRALRHIHMTPKDAEAAGVENGEFVSVRIKGDRPAVLEGVLIRVSEKYSLEMHIDTDEANAVGMPAEAMGQIVVE